VKNALKVLCIGLALLLISAPAFSQLNLGQISGTVTDSSGSVVPGATVTVTDVARGVSRTLTTDSVGSYSAPSLAPGTYTVRAELTGFTTAERRGIDVGVGQELRIDLSLQVGEQSQTVVVSGTPPIVNTTSAVISTTLEAKTINALPLSGRLYTKVLDYTPGVAGRPGGNTPTYSSNGAGTMTNMWMLDGVDDVNQFAASGPLFGATTSADELTILPLDSVQEINIMANPRAEFGWEQGAVVNVGLKSGTNTLHGSAYLYGRDTAWDEKSPYLGSLPKADDVFKQFGGSVGGPIIKDKLFFFGNYEGFRYTVGAPSILQVPSSLSLGGDPTNSFPDAIADLRANGITPSQLSLNLAGCTAQGICDPRKGIFTNGTSSPLLPSGLDNIGYSDNQIEKLDYHPNDRNNINGEFLFGNATDQTAGVGLQPYWANTDHNRVMVVRGVWVNVASSNVVNEARFGYDRYNLQDYNAECTQNLGQPNYLKAFGFASGINAPSPECGFPVINIGGFAATGAGQFIQDQLVFQNTWHFLDSVSYNHGDHLMKFGGEYHHTLYRGYGAPNNLDGNIQFNGGAAFSTGQGSTALEDFLAGTPTQGQFLLNPVETTAGFNRYAGFFQDDWRVSKTVTLNLGLRYEYEPPVVDAHNAFGNFDPSTSSGMVQQTGGQPLYKTSKLDFGPRVGLAWDVTGKGTTVIRGGTSVAYDTTPIDALVTFQGASLPSIPTGFTLYNADGTIRQSSGNIQSGVPVLQGSQLNWVYNAPGAPVVPVFNAGPSALTCGNGMPVSSAPDAAVNPAPCSLLAKNPDAPRSRMITWTAGIQHAFTNDLSLNAAYVGTHAGGLPEYVNVNQPTPGDNDPNAEQQRRPFYNQFPYFGNILVYSNVGYSNYHALQLNLLERTSHGLTLNAAYTLAHAMTTQSGESDNFPFLKDSTNVSSSYAPMNSTPRHHLGITVSYNIPGKSGFGQILEGWSVNSAVNVWSGVGVDLNDFIIDFSGTGNIIPFQGNYWNLYGNASDFSAIFGRTTPVPYFSGANLPQACIAAAAAEPTNPKVRGSSGLASLNAFGCYMAGNSVIIPPAFGTIGNMYRNEITGAPFREWNFSVAKEWKLPQRITAQFRVEAFNLINNNNYGPASGEPFLSSSFGVSTAPVTAGNPVNGTGDARRIQIGLKLSF
jgi:Carboxypeptidase regulatory-like domain/TonB dependent receptor